MASKDKGKGKAQASSPAPSSSKPSSGAANGTSAAPSASAAPPMHTKGDWSAVWNADVGKYYYWNRKTNTTTWTNPFEGGEAASASPAAVTEQPEASGSKQAETAKSQSPQPAPAARAVSENETAQPSQDSKVDLPAGPTRADFGGIDPELAYLDPTLASRARGAGGAGAYEARFNARTGRFEGDPARNPDRVSDVQRAKRQNQFYFDYDGWQATLAQQQEQASLKRAAGELDDDSAKRQRPSKKEMDAIKARNKEKKDKKQKGWLLS